MARTRTEPRRRFIPPTLRIKKRDEVKQDQENSVVKQGNESRQKESVRCRSTGAVRQNSSIFDQPRFSYRPPSSSSPRNLEFVDNGEPMALRYKESLMKFVKNMGPIAQKMASEKLMFVNQALGQSPMEQNEDTPNIEYPPPEIDNEDRIRKGKMILGPDSVDHHRVADPSARNGKMVSGADSFGRLPWMDTSAQNNIGGAGGDLFNNHKKERNYTSLMDSVGSDPNILKGKRVAEADYFDSRQLETNQFLRMSSDIIDPFQKR